MRLIPGFVRSAGGPVLAIARGDAFGASRVTAKSGGEDVDVTVTRLVVDPRFMNALEERRVSVYRLDLGACRGPRVSVAVAVGGDEIANLEVAVVPDRVPEGGLTFAYASCYYDYVGHADAYAAALRGRFALGVPAFKILGGDNVYVDIVPGMFWKDDAFEETADLYVRYFLESAYANVLASSPTVTTWDDHEFWNNFPEPQVHLGRSRPGKPAREFTDAALAAIDLFQEPLNPEPPAAYGMGGRSYVFTIDPVSFFVADCRTNRGRHTGPASSMMTASDLAALGRWARGLEAPGVLVLGQPLWIAQGNFQDYNPPDFEDDYGAIWSALEEAPFDVLVLSGDVHHSRVLSIQMRRGFVHEIVSSPAVHIPPDLLNGLGSVFDHSFAQSRSKVEYPRTVAIAPSWGVRVNLHEEVCAHAEPNTFALVQLRPVGAGRVDVGVTLVDTLGGAPAANVLASRAGRTCHLARAFSLSPR